MSVVLQYCSSEYERRGKLIAALSECSRHKNLENGKRIHEVACQTGDDSNICVASMLVNMYSKCGSLQDAQRVFDSILHPNVVCWNTLILGYAANGEGDIALVLFSKMRRENCLPDARTFVGAAKACIGLDLNQNLKTSVGKKLHLLSTQLGYDAHICLQGAYIELFAKAGSMECAWRFFCSVKNPDAVCWTTLILGYVDNGEGEMALSMFSRMRSENCAPSVRTFVASLKACAFLAGENREVNDTITYREKGNAVHLLAVTCGCGSNIYVQATLLDVYAKSGSMPDACTYFGSIKYPNIVCWNILMVGFADNGEGEQALATFDNMKREGYAPNEYSFFAVFKACSILGSLEAGKKYHGEICNYSFKNSGLLKNCLVDFYAKCGSLIEAQEVFDAHLARDIVTWNALMAGYSRLGDTRGMLDLFDRMLVAGMQPNDVSFLLILTACNHAGLVDEGKTYFKNMSGKYRIKPNLQHYTCMIDMLGRGNKFDEALAMRKDMYLSSDTVIWTTMLGSCCKWGNVEVGELAFQSLITLDAGNCGAYILMANIYGSRGMLVDQAKVQAMQSAARRFGASF